MASLLKQARAFKFDNSKAKLNQYYRFEKIFDRWIHSSNQQVKGLPEQYFIVSGVTDALNQLYGLYNKIGIFDGEYLYHQNVLLYLVEVVYLVKISKILLNMLI